MEGKGATAERENTGCLTKADFCHRFLDKLMEAL